MFNIYCLYYILYYIIYYLLFVSYFYIIKYMGMFAKSDFGCIGYFRDSRKYIWVKIG